MKVENYQKIEDEQGEGEETEAEEEEINKTRRCECCNVFICIVYYLSVILKGVVYRIRTRCTNLKKWLKCKFAKEEEEKTIYYDSFIEVTSKNNSIYWRVNDAKLEYPRKIPIPNSERELIACFGCGLQFFTCAYKDDVVWYSKTAVITKKKNKECCEELRYFCPDCFVFLEGKRVGLDSTITI
jgi:hypothetical protein